MLNDCETRKCACVESKSVHTQTHTHSQKHSHIIYLRACVFVWQMIYIAGSLTSAAALHITWVGDPIVMTFLSLDQIIKISRITSSVERKNRKIQCEF